MMTEPFTSVQGTSPFSALTTQHLPAPHRERGGLGRGRRGRAQHLKATNQHPAQVLLTVLRALGYSGTTFGEMSGEIAGPG